MGADACARCGAPLVGRRRFCTNCGAPAGQQVAAPRQAETSAPDSFPSQPVLVVRVSVLKHLLRPRRWALWAVLVGAGVGGWLLGLPPAGVLAVAGLTVVVVAGLARQPPRDLSGPDRAA